MKRPGLVLALGAVALVLGFLAFRYLQTPRSENFFSDEVRLGSVEAVVSLKGSLATFAGGLAIRANATRDDLSKVTIGQKATFSIIGDPARYEAVLRSVENPAADAEIAARTQAEALATARAQAANAADAAAAEAADRGEAIEETTTEDGASAPSIPGRPPPGEETYLAVLMVNGPTGGLRPGMVVEARIPLGKITQAPVIPVAALGPQGTDGRYAVQLVEDNGRVVQRDVVIGVIDDVAAEVKSGLALGDRVVTGQAVRNKPIARPSAFELLFKRTE